MSETETFANRCASEIVGAATMEASRYGFIFASDLCEVGLTKALIIPSFMVHIIADTDRSRIIS